MFSILLLICAIALLWAANRKRASLGLPGSRIIYSDTKTWGTMDKPLYDAELRLTGKPDYIIETHRQIIPVEVKSGRISSSPHDSHIFQLAAYCLLIHRHYGIRPAYGIIHYPNRTFAVDYTPSLEKDLIYLLEDIHSKERLRELYRSHDSAARCYGCGFRAVCDQKLL